jgi:GDPmannose 4,6-dehydratase
MKKKALITGITGQDGSYLAELLLKKNYLVHGIIRRSSQFNTQRIDHLYQSPFTNKKTLTLHYGDLTDPLSVHKIINKIKPHEIYNLAAQSHVKVSFDNPYLTSNINAIGTLNILETIKSLKLFKTKFYQASSSELFGNNLNKLNEETNFAPESPYATSKLFAYWITINYRKSYKMFCSNGILFNHESPRRGSTFVTKKIVEGLVAVKKNKLKYLYLGNLNAQRDWGHAKDYVEAQWRILQYKKPDDFVIATGIKTSVRNFLLECSKYLGMNIKFKNQGLNEIGVDNKGKIIVKIKKKYFRPSEVPSLLGDASKAKKNLLWKPKYYLKDIIKDMIDEELKKYEKN